MSIAPILELDEESGPRGPYRKTADTQQRILDAAVSVFAESGFEKGSLREVAKAAGLSHAGLLHHFPTKVALLSAVVQRRDDAALAETQVSTQGVARLQALVDFARRSTENAEEIALFAVLSAEATRPSHAANEYMKRRYAWTTEVVTETFQHVADDGMLRPELDPRLVGTMFMALWDGLQLRWLLDPDALDIATDLGIFLDQTLIAPLAELIRRD